MSSTVVAVTKLRSSASRSRKTVAGGASEEGYFSPDRYNERGFASASGQKVLDGLGGSLRKGVEKNLVLDRIGKNLKRGVTSNLEKLT